MKEEMKYVAITTYCAQTGPEQWEQLTRCLECNSFTTIGEIQEWANKVSGAIPPYNASFKIEVIEITNP